MTSDSAPSLRKLQAEAAQVVDDILGGSQVDTVVLKAVPGAGKSTIPIIMGRLIPKMADAICWVVPRKTLQKQGEANFQDPFFRKLLNHRLSIRSSTNDVNPCRGLNGFVTTYQAIAVPGALEALKREFSSKRYILVADEFHHAEEDGDWHQALQPLADLASFLLLMTGTLERGNGSKIAFIRYRASNNRIEPVLDSSENVRVIEYSRSDALKERAIIPLHFFFSDAQVSWIDEIGATVEVESLARVTAKEATKAIYSAIDTDYANELMEQAVGHWLEHRKAIPGAKLLVVTANIKHARAALKWLKARHFNTEIATSHESDDAQKAIARLKSGDIDILVSICMIYEGLDCQSATHIVSLTHIRSNPWLEQMLARAVRVDKAHPYEIQTAFIFTPDDPLMRSVVEKIQAEQLPYLKKRAPKKQAGLFEGTGDPTGKNPLGITPIGSRLTGGRQYQLGGPAVQAAPAPVIPSDIEADLRDKIESHVRRYAWLNRYKEQQINTELRQRFGKPRGEMTIPELKGVYSYLTTNLSTTRPARGTGQRVSRKAVRYYGEAV